MTYLVPILGTAIAIFGLFIDTGKRNFRVLAPLLISIITILGIFQVFDLRDAAQDAQEAKEQRTMTVKLLDNVSVASARTSSYLSNILLAQPKVLENWGLTETRAGKPLVQISTEDLQEGQILAADQFRTELIEDRIPSTRQDIKVWYYTKEVDIPQLRQALAEVGFDVLNQVPTSFQKNDPTNAVWHGPEVDLNDYKAVIVTLIRAGIDIRRVGPSCNNRENKRKVIEVGASDEAAGLITGVLKPSKNIKDIREAMSFDQLDDFAC
ncbi:MAG: hypothetical protein AAGG02_09340 [Cyanobacteria bacterium P01_H01_bin.15]